MFTYKVIKHEDAENGILYGLYEVANDDESADGEAVVMGQTPVNGVFYESLDELVEHITELYTYVNAIASGDQSILNADDVTFVDLEGEECEEGCDHDHGAEGFHSFDEDKVGQTNDKKKECCGGGCGCHS